MHRRPSHKASWLCYIKPVWKPAPLEPPTTTATRDGRYAAREGGSLRYLTYLAILRAGWLQARWYLDFVDCAGNDHAAIFFVVQSIKLFGELRDGDGEHGAGVAVEWLVKERFEKGSLQGFLFNQTFANHDEALFVLEQRSVG